ncbi:hypothetical protein [Microcoleus sp.]|uniref:hypothetical protein n=1 Tax=Microcoleus sp. TaxID=44472 RepID=UPI003594248F
MQPWSGKEVEHEDVTSAASKPVANAGKRRWDMGVQERGGVWELMQDKCGGRMQAHSQPASHRKCD